MARHLRNWRSYVHLACIENAMNLDHLSHESEHGCGEDEISYHDRPLRPAAHAIQLISQWNASNIGNFSTCWSIMGKGPPFLSVREPLVLPPSQCMRHKPQLTSIHSFVVAARFRDALQDSRKYNLNPNTMDDTDRGTTMPPHRTKSPDTLGRRRTMGWRCATESHRWRDRSRPGTHQPGT